jgi:hypothetical protein
MIASDKQYGATCYGYQEQAKIIIPLAGVPEWLTGEQFGFEASVPGLIGVLVTLILLYMWKPS